MGAILKFKSWIFQEPQNKNASPKAVVVLRISCLLYMLYLLVAGVSFACMAMPYMVMFSAMFLILYAYTLYCTYQDRIHSACMLMNAITLVWVAMFYLFFGDSIGVQHFMYALIIVDLLIIRIYPLFTLLGLYIVRLVLYVTNIYHPMLHETAFSGNMQLFMYLLSLVLECAMVLFNGIYFTKDAFQMESRLQDYNEELRHVASTDPLTQVWNRFRMLEYVDKCLRKCSRGEMDFISVAIGDIDFFKHVNDTYGHECGDEVLKSLAGLFKKEMEGHGAVARWGGEEFLFLFKNMNGDEAMAELSTIQSKLTRMKIPYEDQVLQVTMTFGLTEYDMHLSLDENIKAADDKLYQGKEGGRNRIVY